MGLLQQALQLILNGQVEFGYVNKAREVIKLKSTMIKSPEQIQAVRNSPEFLRCTEQVKLGQPLSHVCEITRHQATSIDEIRSELIIPTYLTKYSIIPNVAGMVKSLLIGNLIEPVTVKPLVQQHLVKRMPSSGKVCISKQMVKICSKVNKSETEEPKPIKVQRKVLEYVCEEASTPLAQQLEQRAKSGEILTLEI